MYSRIGLSLFIFFISSFAHAFLSSDQIINSFKNSDFKSGKKFDGIIAPVNEVVSIDLQKSQKNYSNKTIMDFGDVQQSVDLRHRDTEVVKQVGGRCSAYGLVASMENLIGQPDKFRLSPSHLFNKYFKYSSSAAVETARKANITQHKYWPHHRRWIPKLGFRRNAKSRLTHITYINNDIAKAVKALDEGRPVYIGMAVTSSMGNCDPVIDPNSYPTGGGHAVSISGYELNSNVPGGGYFILKNSWGKGCGDEGYQYMPFNHCTNGGNYYCIMWDVQGVRTGLKGITSVQPVNVEFNPELVHVDISSKGLWYTKRNRVKVHVHGDARHTKQIAEVRFSLDNYSWEAKRRISIDEFYWSFKTLKKSHQIHIEYVLEDGRTFKQTLNYKV
jgi:hypothetical protein